jgi:hypothetical protein
MLAEGSMPINQSAISLCGWHLKISAILERVLGALVSVIEARWCAQGILLQGDPSFQSGLCSDGSSCSRPSSNRYRIPGHSVRR